MTKDWSGGRFGVCLCESFWRESVCCLNLWMTHNGFLAFPYDPAWEWPRWGSLSLCVSCSRECGAPQDWSQLEHQQITAQVPHGGVGKGTMSSNRWLLWGPYCGSSFVLRALSVETHLKLKPSLLVGTVTLLWQMVTSKHRLCIASKCEEPEQEPRQSGSRACVLSPSLWGGLGSSVWYHFCY